MYLLVGESGVGKSTFGDVLLGRLEVFPVSHDTVNPNTKIRVSQKANGDVVIDTIGFTDDDDQNFKMIQALADILRNWKWGIVICLVMNGQVNRLWKGMDRIFRGLDSLFPNVDWPNNVCVIVTKCTIIGPFSSWPEHQGTYFRSLATIIDRVRQGRGGVIEQLERRFFVDSLAEDEATIHHTEQEIVRLLQFAQRCCPLPMGPRPEVMPFYKLKKERKNRMVDQMNLPNQKVEIWQAFERERRETFNGDISFTEWKPVDDTWQMIHVEKREEINEESSESEEEPRNPLEPSQFLGLFTNSRLIFGLSRRD
jgi:hypothetical protein